MVVLRAISAVQETSLICCQLFADPTRILVYKLANAAKALASCSANGEALSTCFANTVEALALCLSPVCCTYCTCVVRATLIIYAHFCWPRVGWARSGEGNEDSAAPN